MKFGSLELVNNSICIAYPVFGGCYENITISPRESQEHTYTQNNGVVSFVDGGKVFVTPYSRRRLAALVEAGFREGGNLWVPFSNGDIPKDSLQAKMWENLQKEAGRERVEDYENDCAKLAKAKHIKPLDENFLQEFCIRVPAEGLEIQKYERPAQRHYPAFSAFIPFDEERLRLAIGTYTANNGVVAFIDHRGREYVMPGFHKLDILEAAGYKNYAMIWVVMSNGERFVDPYLQSKWAGLKKAADAWRDA